MKGRGSVNSGPVEPSNPFKNEPSTELFENDLKIRYSTI